MVDSKDFFKLSYCKSRRPDNCLLALVEDMIVLLDENFDIKYASPAFLKIFSCEKGELADKLFLSFILAQDKYIVGDALECAIRMSGEKISVQCQFVDPIDGNAHYYEMIIKSHLTNKTFPFLLLDIRDITDRVKLQERISEQDQRWKIIFENAKDAMLVVDQKGTCLALNHVVCEKLGYLEDELFLTNILRVVAPEYQDRARLRLLGKIEDEDEIFESLYVRKDGSLLPVELSCGKIMFNGQKCLLAVVRDISRRKQLEAEKEQLQKQFLQAQKMETVGRLAAGIAHDFNNLLTILMNNLGLLSMDLSPFDPFYPQVDECQKAVDQAASLTKQLLTFSRPQISEETETVNLGALLKSMHAMLRRLLPENIHLLMNYDKVQAFIHMNKSNIEQVLVNLVVNARDALLDGGEITVSLRRIEEQVILTVADNGIGIPLEIQDKIFEPFFSTKGTSGTGLGLFTVYGLVFKADGKLNLRSSPGKGSIFELIFPGVLPREDSNPLATVHNFATKTATILVVEDDEGINKLVVKILNQAKYQVLSCRSAEEALKLFEQIAENQKVDLLFTDVTMPGMTGIQLAKKLKDAGLVNQCLLTSGYVRNKESLPDIEENQGEQWKIDYLGKPYGIPDLLAKIKNLLE